MKYKLLILVVFSFFIFSHNAFAAKINIDNNSVTMQENGDSKTFTITLDEPIITSGEDPAYVTINLSTNDNHLILSTTTVTFAANEWFQAKQFIVTTSENSVSHDDNNSPSIALSVASNSEYYSNFSIPSILVTLLDNDSVSDNSPAPSHRSGGSTVQSRVANLIKMGNVSEANILMQQFPNLFPQKNVSTTSTSTIFIRDLKKGMSGKDVLALQQFLIKQNVGIVAQTLEKSVANGYFGNITKSALIEFQKSVGIKPATGNFGPKTKAYLKSIGY